MEQHDWQRVEALFHQALELEESEIEPFLQQACADAPELKQAVLSLLQHADHTVELVRPIEGAAQEFCLNRHTLWSASWPLPDCQTARQRWYGRRVSGRAGG